MNEQYGHDIEDLHVGMSASFAKTITEADIVLFAGVSGDNNAVHTNEEFAATTAVRRAHCPRLPDRQRDFGCRGQPAAWSWHGVHGPAVALSGPGAARRHRSRHRHRQVGEPGQGTCRAGNRVPRARDGGDRRRGHGHDHVGCPSGQGCGGSGDCCGLTASVIRLH
jgi:hypothetical protein